MVGLKSLLRYKMLSSFDPSSAHHTDTKIYYFSTFYQTHKLCFMCSPKQTAILQQNVLEVGMGVGVGWGFKGCSLTCAPVRKMYNLSLKELSIRFIVAHSRFLHLRCHQMKIFFSNIPWTLNIIIFSQNKEKKLVQPWWLGL